MNSVLLPCLAFALTACSAATPPDVAEAPAEMSAAAKAPTVVAEPSRVRPEVPAPVLHYQCGDLLVSTQLRANSMQLSFSGRSRTLPLVPAASGVKYDDGEGNSFWNKGNDAMLTLDRKDVGRCTTSERASPWVDAQARNIGFRAVGSEPGWYVEVGRGESPPLHALVDYGQREIDIASAEQLTGDTAGFRGMATDGTAIELRISRTSCNDGMSGEAFEASAELLVADKPYKGCGAYLE